MEPVTPVDPKNDRGKRHKSREVANAISVLPELARCRVDPENMLAIVGIVGTVLNLLVVVLVYIYTPI